VAHPWGENAGGNQTRPRECFPLPRAWLATLTVDSSERSDKKTRTGVVRPSAVVDMELVTRHKRIESGRDNNPDIQQDSDLNHMRVAFGSSVGAEAASKIVNQVRERLRSMSLGPKNQDCASCFTVLGKREPNHKAGNRCPLSLCSEGDATWQAFKASLVYERDYLCFGCLLPTVSVFVRPPVAPC